jgi:hypothetical protein
MAKKVLDASHSLCSSGPASVARIAASFDYLDKYDVAHILKVSVRTIEKWTRERKIPYYKASYHTVRYRLADITRSMRKNHFMEEVAVE